jgi:hypothetical protein
LNGAKVRSFLERLAVRDEVSASTQNQVLNALVMFFREGLSKELGEFAPAKRPKRMPVVLTRGVFVEGVVLVGVLDKRAKRRALAPFAQQFHEDFRQTVTEEFPV